MTNLVVMRVIGSLLVVVGYFTILHVNVTAGVVINLVADALSIPFFVQAKAFDVVGLLGFLSAISVSKLLT